MVVVDPRMMLQSRDRLKTPIYKNKPIISKNAHVQYALQVANEPLLNLDDSPTRPEKSSSIITPTSVKIAANGKK